MNRMQIVPTLLTLLVLAPAAVGAAEPSSATLSEGTPEVTWIGGPFAASNSVGCVGANDPTCDHFLLTVEVPSFAPYVVVVEIDSTSAAPDADDYDLFVYDAAGAELDNSASSGSFERVALPDLAAGTYRVEIQPWLITPGSTYAGTARLLDANPPPLVSVAPAAGDETAFSTPTLVDSQLHTGEPSIAVSPVLPADGSRPMIVADAPWGTSNATSLWWRSRDGGASFELVQDPLAAPRPRPCEEIDGGGDSDTSFDHEGRIYVNDLAALVNITVGVSDDDFQTMRCTKAGGSNPLQPIQDRQWIAAAPDADGAGPAVDAYMTFRRGLIDGNPVTETAIQIYETTDGGESYQPVGEIVDFFGFSNGKVSQTGNPVVDTSDGPRRGTLYQSYYVTSTAKIGRYTPSTGSFESFTVAARLSNVGNVFPALAIDTAGNLYYSWVEGGSFDVLFAVSTDGGESWSTPVRLNLPGDAELAVNPFAVAGSPGRVAVLYNATAHGSNPDSATGAWHLYVARSTNALDPSPSFVQHKVTDTPLHFGAICTRGLGCNLSVPEGDRSLLEFNEVDVDPLDGSLVFIFADNGRHVQPPLEADEIPQPYIMATRQSAGESMLAGRTVRDTLPRSDVATDPVGDATYPKAGTTEGPNHPALDLTASRIEETSDGVRVVIEADDLSDLSRSLQPAYGLGDPRLTQRAFWLTRFEVVYDTDVNEGLETREEVYAAGMEYDRVLGGPTFWYGPVGVARNALLDAKRSDYGSQHGTVTTGTLDGNRISVEIPWQAMGIDRAVDPSPSFHSVVSFALAQPESTLDGIEVETYFNNQRTVDATRAYDWSPGSRSCTTIDDADPAVEYRRGWHRRSADEASEGGYHRRVGSPGGAAPTARLVFTGDEVTYRYVGSSRGGSAEILLDGELVDTVSFGAGITGPKTLTFGLSRTYSGLTAGSHELTIRHGSGISSVDGFEVCGPAPASDISAPAYRSETSVDTLTATEGLLVERTVTVGDQDEEVSVVAEGAAAPLTVRLLDPSGQLLAEGDALLDGFAVSGLDAAAEGPGEYTVQIVNLDGVFQTLELSVARTVRISAD